MRNELSDAKAWADRVLRNGLLDAPEDDAHLRVLLSALSASPPGEGEPVAWIDPDELKWLGEGDYREALVRGWASDDHVALFAHPPGGLSVEDWARLIAAADGVTWADGVVTYRGVGDEDEPATARYYRMAQAILAAMEPRRADLIDIEQGREGKDRSQSESASPAEAGSHGQAARVLASSKGLT